MSKREMIEVASHVFEVVDGGLRCYKARCGDYERGAVYGADQVAAFADKVPQATVLIVKEVR